MSTARFDRPQSAEYGQSQGSSVNSLLVRGVASNVPFVATFLAFPAWPDVLQAIVAAAIVFFVPGMAWADRRRGDGVAVLFRVVVISLVAAVVTWCVLVPLPGLTSRTAFIVVLWIFTNVGLWRGSARGWFTAAPFGTPLFRALMVVALYLAVQSYVGAAHRIPALQDQDSETQGTAYGLMHHFEPSMVTNRNSTYFFAHPLLLHFWIGQSALITDDLDRLKYYYDSAIAVRGEPEEVLDAQWAVDHQQFLRDPVLLPTRTPNIVIGALVLFPLGFVVYRLTGSRLAAVGAGVVYATMPEIYVRSAYGGYMAVANFLALSGAYFYLHASTSATDIDAEPPRRWMQRAFAAAVLGALADQKIILVAMAATARAGLLAIGRGVRGALSMPAVRTAVVIVAGFGTGWLIFALYGSSVSRWAFFHDHVVGHVLDRIRLQDVNLATDQTTGWAYPSIVALWLEFARHTGWLIAVPMALSCVWGLTRLQTPVGLLVLWAWIGAIGFSLVDWRHTKHLAQVTPALTVLVACYWCTLGRRGQMLVAAMLAAGVVGNLWRVGRLMADFTYLQPNPIW